MKKSALAIGVWAAAVLLAQGAEPFSRSVSADEFASAGLAKLSPSELAQLDVLFAKYRTARAEPAPTVARAVGTPPTPTAPAKPALRKTEPAADNDSLISKAKKIFTQTKESAHPGSIEGQIDGWFDGWTSNTMWRLKDGTQWRAENSQPGFTSNPVRDPKVKIYPAAINGYWLEFSELDQKVRVRQLP